jgi:hypothetical protein
MSDRKETILVHANVEMTTASLEAIVTNAKKLSRKDTADLVGEMISQFLLGQGFEAYVKNLGNYSV